MSALQTATLVYFCAGLTCWLVLVAAYFRRGDLTTNVGSALAKMLVAIPVIALWPLLLIELLRSDRAEKRARSLRMKQDEPS